MTTGINHILVEEGHENVTFDDYLFKCMGLHSRSIAEGNYKLDEPKEDSYYQNRIKDAEKELAVIQNQTIKDIAVERQKRYEESLLEHQKRQADNVRIKKTIADWTEKINNWTAPGEHVYIKETMQSQVDELKGNCYAWEAPKKPDLSEEGLKKYKEEAIGYCTESIERYKRQLKEEQETVNNNREWKLSLYKSMKNPPKEVQEVLDNLKEDA